VTLTTHDALLKDLYPLPGTRLKQWAVDSRREAAWERETCPRFDVPVHEDNCGRQCRNFGPTPWTFLDHDSCYVCCDMYEDKGQYEPVTTWLGHRANRPPIEADRDKLSDEVEADWPSMKNSLLTRMTSK
jgi:hypothetical protein